MKFSGCIWNLSLLFANAEVGNKEWAEVRVGGEMGPLLCISTSDNQCCCFCDTALSVTPHANHGGIVWAIKERRKYDGRDQLTQVPWRKSWFKSHNTNTLHFMYASYWQYYLKAQHTFPLLRWLQTFRPGWPRNSGLGPKHLRGTLSEQRVRLDGDSFPQLWNLRG